MHRVISGGARGSLAAVVVVALAATLAVATGCARVAVYTEVAADGTYTREILFTASPETDGQPQMMGGPTLAEAFDLPDEDDGWTLEAESTEDEAKCTARKTFGAGAASKGDVRIRGKGGAWIVNEMSVRREGDRLTYREVLRWEGDPPEEAVMGFDDEDLERLRAALPDGTTDEELRTVAGRIEELLVDLIFDPADPFFNQMFSHPELVTRRLRRRAGILLDRTLVDVFGERLSEEERGKVLERLLDESDPVKGTREDAQPGGGEEDDDDKPVPISLYLVMPGKVVDTNGKIDEITGDVYWALFSSMAASLEVELYAVCEIE